MGKSGLCSDCERPLTSIAFCKDCDGEYLRNNFRNWTSGNTKLDDFIKYVQLNAKNHMDYLEWINFDQFDLIENTRKQGGFSSIYSAVWLEGPRWNLDKEFKEWIRYGPTKVILKRLNDSQNMSQDFINQLYRYHKCMQNCSLVEYYGITRDSTSCYMFVMGYYNNGNLYSLLDKSMKALTWNNILDALWSIIAGIDAIHQLDLVHGHLHGGNMLVHKDLDSIDVKIADTGLHAKKNYGVLPFVAPEVLNGDEPTKESDIYSFGMIMWMMSAGVCPYHDRPHDKKLKQEICSGLRPNIISGTPVIYQDLMRQCFDGNKFNRPSASKINQIIEKWVNEVWDESLQSKIQEQFDNSDEIRLLELERLAKFGLGNIGYLQIHEEAIYHSRSLEF